MKNHGYKVADKDVIWKHIFDFYQIDSQKFVRAAPNLLLRHVTLPPFSHLKVSLATQVFPPDFVLFVCFVIHMLLFFLHMDLIKKMYGNLNSPNNQIW